MAIAEGKVIYRQCRPAPHSSPHPIPAFPRLSLLHLQFGFKRQDKVKSLPRKSRREGGLLSQRRAVLPGVLCPPNGAEPPPHPRNRQHPGGLCRERSFALYIISSTKEEDFKALQWFITRLAKHNLLQLESAQDRQAERGTCWRRGNRGASLYLIFPTAILS